MATLTGVLSKYIRPYLPIIISIIITIILVIIAAFYLIRRNKQEKNKQFSDVANENRRTKEAEILFFNVTWCVQL